jgi:hypothetical protein
MLEINIVMKVGRKFRVLILSNGRPRGAAGGVGFGHGLTVQPEAHDEERDQPTALQRWFPTSRKEWGLWS